MVLTPAEPLDMLPHLRSSLIAGDPDRGIDIAELVEEWKGEPAVFTRRPVPADAPDLIIICNPAITILDEDALVSRRPVWTSTIAIYGRKGAPGSADDQTREVEALGWRIRALFHRQRFSVRPEGFSVIEVTAGGPVPGPTDDDKQVARIVQLRIRLRENN